MRRMVVAVGLALLASVASAQVNILPNSQWQIATGLEAYAQTPTVSQVAEGEVVFGPKGDLYLSTTAPAGHWWNASIDINGFGL